MDWSTLAPFFVVWALAASSAGSFVLAVWSLTWPRVKGKVELSFADPTVIEYVEGGSRRSDAYELAYSYAVGDASYLSGNVKPWGNYNWHVYPNGDVDGFSNERPIWSRARDLAQWYRPGVIVDVYYCPLRPQWACLEPGGFLIPALLGGIAAFLYFLLLH